MLVRRIARPLLSTIFIAGGIDAVRNPAGKADAATPLIDKSAETLPAAVAQRIPSNPETLVRINGAVQVAGGVLLAAGRAPRLASLALAGSLVPTTLAGHDFWNQTDPAARAAQRTQFFKNMSLLGGLLIAAVDTEGKPSVGWRGRRAARNAQATVAAALPLAASRPFTTNGEVIEHGTKLLESAKERGTEFAKGALERSSDLIDVAKERSSDLIDVAKDRGPDLVGAARDKSAVWATSAAEHSEILGRQARHRAEIAVAHTEIALEKARAKAAGLAAQH